VIALRRIDHVCLRVADLDEAARRWCIQFGFSERSDLRTADRAYLACGYEPYSLELWSARADAGHDHSGFELREGCTPDDAAAHLEALGVAFRRTNVWYLGDVYFPNLPGEPDVVLAMRTFLQERFLFSTGYPFCPLKAVVDRYLGFGLPDRVLENVMGLNAARLFGL
jgi:catechol 2,3-dioxygenase-like lactoylglutathione lyase family enzyme